MNILDFIKNMLSIFLGQDAFAAQQSTMSNTALTNPLSNANTLAAFLDNILTVVIDIGAVVIVFFIIYSGFLYVVARGNPEKIKEAHTTLWWTIVGAAIILGAKVISAAIAGTVGSLK